MHQDPRDPHDADLARHDRDRARSHQAERREPDRHAAWPKDDLRSSSRLASDDDHMTEEERGASWPLG